MSRYDGLIIPRSYSEYINKTDAATLLQALQLSGVMDAAPTAGSNRPITSNAVSAIKAITDMLYTRNELYKIRELPFISHVDLPSHSTEDTVYFQEWYAYMSNAGYFDEGHDIFIAHANPNFEVIVIGYTYGGALKNTWGSFIYLNPNGMGKFGYNNGNWYFIAAQ